MAFNFSSKLLEYCAYQVEFFDLNDQSWQGHFGFAEILTKELQPKKIVELGTLNGNSYFVFCQAVKQHGLSTSCTAVGSWRSEHDEQQPALNNMYQRILAYNQKEYSGFSTILRRDLTESASDFDDESIDVLNIDGAKSKADIQHLFSLYAAKVRPGGLVLIHDVNDDIKGCTVNKFWHTLQEQNAENCLTFPQTNGLGVWRKPGGKRFKSAIFNVLMGGDTPERTLAIKYITMMTDRALCYHYLYHQKQMIEQLRSGKK